MKLPTELRLQVYLFHLPSRDAEDNSTAWSSGPCGSKGCLSLLLVNRKISNETREMVYSHNSVTVELSGQRIELLSSDLPRYWWSFTPIRFQIFPITPSFRFIKHWQLNLRFRTHYSCSREQDTYCYDGRPSKHTFTKFEMDKLSISDRLLETASELAKLDEIQSLKVKFPCLCGICSYERASVPTEMLVRMLCSVLQPLRSLKQPAMFIAASPTQVDAISFDLVSSQTCNTQCLEPACAAFVAQVQRLHRKQLQGSLSAQQRKWLDINHRAASIEEDWPAASFTDVACSLERLWTLADFHQDVFNSKKGDQSLESRRRESNQYYKAAENNLKAAVKDAKIFYATSYRRFR